MKDTKRRVEFFSFYDHTGIEAHLERMAQRGWLLEKAGNFIWRYRRIEPKQLAFSVCYFPKASQFDPEPTEEQETFYDLCAHAGWTLAASSAQMQVFYNERPDPVPIDTDPVLEVEAIHRSAKKNFLLSKGLLAVVAAMNFGVFLQQLFDTPVSILSNPLAMDALVCWPMLLLLIGTDFAAYFRWRRRALKAAAQGEFLATKGHPVLQKTVLAVVLAGLVWCLSCLRGGMLAGVAAALACTFGIVFLLERTRELLKRKKVSKDTNLVATYGVYVTLSFLVLVFVFSFVIGSDQDGWREGDVTSEELPLALTELLGLPGDTPDWHRDADSTRSPLVGWLETRQYIGEYGGPDNCWLTYRLVTVRAPFLYDTCKNDMLTRHDTRGNERVPEGNKRWYEPADPAPWGALEAYEEYFQNPAVTGPTYLLCYPGRIVEIDFDWEPTREQIALAAEKLGGQ